MIDEKILNEYYSKIANKLNEMIPCEWTKIILYAEETGDVSTGSFYFYTSDSKFHWSENIPKEYNFNKQIFRKKQIELWQINEGLWTEFKKTGETMWYSYVFELNDKWEFKIKYKYEKDSTISSTQRRVIWAYDELNIIPVSNYEKKILKEYLQNQGQELPNELKW